MAETRTRRYGPEERALILVELQQTAPEPADWIVKRAARNLQLPESTVRDFKRAYLADPEAVKASCVVAEEDGSKRDAYEAARNETLSRLRSIRDAGFDRVAEDLPNMKGKDAAWVAFVAQDKIRNLEGQPTERSEVVHTHRLDAAQQRQLAESFAQAWDQSMARSREVNHIIDAEAIEVTPELEPGQEN